MNDDRCPRHRSRANPQLRALWPSAFPLYHMDPVPYPYTTWTQCLTPTQHEPSALPLHHMDPVPYPYTTWTQCLTPTQHGPSALPLHNMDPVPYPYTTWTQCLTPTPHGPSALPLHHMDPVPYPYTTWTQCLTPTPQRLAHLSNKAKWTVVSEEHLTYLANTCRPSGYCQQSNQLYSDKHYSQLKVEIIKIVKYYHEQEFTSILEIYALFLITYRSEVINNNKKGQLGKHTKPNYTFY